MTTTRNAPTPLHPVEDAAAGKALYGHVFWYTVADATYDYDVVKAELDALGIGKHAPRRPADVDVFRRVSTSAADGHIDLHNGTYANVLVRDVTNEGQDDTVLRRVVVETVDAQGEALDYREAYDLRFHKADSRITYLPLTMEKTPADDIVSSIRAAYREKQGTINGDGIRTMIRKTMRGHNAVAVRPSGGVFFVPASDEDALMALHDWARRHRGNVMLFSVPLAAAEQNHEMLTAAFTDDAVTDAEKLLAELGSGVSKRRLDSIVAEHAALKGRLSTYQVLLDDQLVTVGAQLQMIDLALTGAAQAATAQAA